MATPLDRNVASPSGNVGKAAVRPGRWSDLGLRVASAAVLAPVALACVWFGGLAWTALIMAASFGLVAEWVTLCGHPLRTWPGRLVLAVVMMATAFGGANLGAAWLVPALIFLGLATFSTLAWDRWLALGIAYVGVPVLALCALRGAPAGRLDVLLLLGVVWASDIGAYFAGRAVGGPKLAPSISPGKTRSGALGGLFAAVLLGSGMAWALAPGSAPAVAALSAILSVASQAGDLFESWVKRRFGVKDSGRTIPGHGGLLDRLDGLLAAAPVMALAAWAGGGGIAWR